MPQRNHKSQIVRLDLPSAIFPGFRCFALAKPQTHVYVGVSARLTACVVVEGRGWNKKRQIVSEPPVVRKAGIRPFSVGQAHLVLGSVACASTCHSSLNGRFPTFRFLRVGRCTSGVYFFQGGSKTHSEALGRVLTRSCWESRLNAT